MNKKLKKQIKIYAGVAGGLLSAGKIEAQVIYHDIVPDDTLSYSSNFHYDFDSDGMTDINASVSSMNLGSASTDPFLGWVSIYGFNNYVQKNTNLIGCHNRQMAFMHNPLDTISSQGNFVQVADLENWIHDAISSSNNCFFAPGNLNTDYCIGIKFSINSLYHYGWMRVELLNHKAIIKDYAYQSQPNVPVLACDLTDLSTGIQENNFQFNFSQQNNSIHITTLQKLNQANTSVYDLLGKEILQQPFEEKETTITIDKQGIYFVEVKSERGIFRKKVFIY